MSVSGNKPLRIEPFKIQRPIAALVGVGISTLVITAAVVSRNAVAPKTGDGLEVLAQNGGADHDGNIRKLARDLFSGHVLAFELTSALLVIAVVGTVVLARKPRKGELDEAAA